MNNWTSNTIPMGDFTKAQVTDQTARPSFARRLLGRGLALVRRYTTSKSIDNETDIAIDRPDRIVLPVSSGVSVKPNTSAQITSRPQNVAFRPMKLIIGGNPEDWTINDIRIGRKSQFVQCGDVPGEMFAANAADSTVCFDVVLTAMDFTIVVTYIGNDPEGALFSCGVLGDAASWVPPTIPQIAPRGFLPSLARGIETILSEIIEPKKTTNAEDAECNLHSLRLILPLSSGSCIMPSTSAMITCRSQETFYPERIILGGHPERWLINDIRVGKRSQFSQSGDVPGEMFRATTLDSFVGFETVQTAMDFSICVTYIGDEPKGEPFTCGVLGTVPSFA